MRPGGRTATRRASRVVLTGSESTGKTTLAGAVAQAMRSLWVPEYARTYAERVQRPLSAHDVPLIARGHLKAVETVEGEWRARFAARTDAPPLVLDTDLLSTVVYARYYYGTCPSWIEDAVQSSLGDLYLLCLPDLPWEADGVRDQPTSRAELHARFVETLQEFGAAVELVRGSGEARRARALSAVSLHAVTTRP